MTTTRRRISQITKRLDSLDLLSVRPRIGSMAEVYKRFAALSGKATPDGLDTSDRMLWEVLSS